ncbi:MAG: hypothetical protein ACYS0H_22905 [Planctomycetota bacterium]|jgi:hypothetical protein
MLKLIIGGLAAGALTVLLCSSKAGNLATGWVASRLSGRKKKWWVSLTSCTFCSSWWISLAMLNEFTLREWAATVAIANITVLLIHWSISTVEEDYDQTLDTEPTIRESHQTSGSRTVWVRGDDPRPV